MWLRSIYPRYFEDLEGNPIPFARHHHDFWRWVWSIRKGQKLPAFFAIWPRGGGKSSSVEMACAVIAARGVRRYGLYIGMSQDQADDHVQNVAALLEAPSYTKVYPRAGQRLVGKYGNSRGWRRNRIRTASGFTIDAIGLDTAARGVKLEDARPDLLIFDDIDGEVDSPDVVARKIRTITTKLIPAGSSDMLAMGVQNLVHNNSVFSRLLDGRADFLTDRVVSGPHPAIAGLTYEEHGGRWLLTGGEPSWAGQDLAHCQQLVNEMGITAFRTELQHEVEVIEGGLYSHITFAHCAHAELPPITRVVVAVDPAVTDSDRADAHGIQVDGEAMDGTIYRLYSWEARTSPEDAIQRAIKKALDPGPGLPRARVVRIETDQGGDTWQSVYRAAWATVMAARGTPFAPVTIPMMGSRAGAGRGPKVHRQQQMLADYERGRIVHVYGTHDTLERALLRYPKQKPYDLADACLVANTMIETDHGPVPIEEIRPGDWVRTRHGFGLVRHAGLTGRDRPLVTARFGNGATLTGTANHPIWTEERGWTPLGESAGLTGIILPCPTLSNPNRSCTTDELGIASGVTTSLVGSASIARSTPIITGQSRQDTKSIIRTAIHSTMIPATSSLFQKRSISPSTETMLGPGTPAPKGSNGIVPTGGMWPRSAPLWSAAVACVASHFAHVRTKARCIARSVVAMLRPSRTREISRRAFALSAAQRSRPRATEPSAFAASPVATVITTTAVGDVYNLQVEGVPEYFANGVLVHNCFWSWDYFRMPSQRPVARDVIYTQDDVAEDAVNPATLRRVHAVFAENRRRRRIEGEEYLLGLVALRAALKEPESPVNQWLTDKEGASKWASDMS